MKARTTVALAAAILVALPAFAGEGMMGHDHAKTEEPGAVCPVDGKAVQGGGLTAEFEGTTYHFDGKACLAAFEKNPAEYAVVVCPVMNHPMKMKDAAAKTEYDGKMWYFCSVQMKEQFEANPEKYATFTCPISGETMTYEKTGASIEYEGKTVRFCCDKCVAPFQKNPDKYWKHEASAAPAPKEGHAEQTGHSH